MKSIATPTPIALAGLLLISATASHAQAEAENPAAASADDTLPAVVVTAPAAAPDSRSTLGSTGTDAATLRALQARSSDTTQLLQATPGVAAQAAGGISSLPVVRGMADERLRVQVDDMDLMAACPNHMNPALSYLPPAQVGQVRVYAGVTPVSVGGDNIGGTVQVQSEAPVFARAGQGILHQGEWGAFYRSNGHAHGTDISAVVAGESVSVRYSASSSQSDNYRAGAAFKPAAPGREGARVIAGDEVASSQYRAYHQRFNVAWRHRTHLLQLGVNWQNAPFEGFPNQRMDMTANRDTQYNLRYQGEYNWGTLRAQAFTQTTEHRMDMGDDRHFYGTGMPMKAWARTQGVNLHGDVLAGDTHLLRLGAQYHSHLLYDWWPPVGASGSMAPLDFWNINAGTRRKADVYAEWEAQWSPRTTSLLGVRYSQVRSNAGPVQGYNASYGADAAAFNTQPHKRTHHNWDATAMLRYTPQAGQVYELGLARKTRAPSLYQLYPWSGNVMAIGMNNFAGDGNGYIGRLSLQPEVAHTASVSAHWHDPAEHPRWSLQATAHASHIRHYIDADRYNGHTATAQFVPLQYTNHTARIVGLDMAGHVQLASSPRLGDWTLRAKASWLQGRNRDTGDALHAIMPPHASLTLEHQRGRWSSALEWEGAAARRHTSSVRNEMRTPGYGLLHLRTSYQYKKLRIDAGIHNLFNRLYYLPLGGAYVGQGRSMMLNTIAWGTPVAGQGRSYHLSARLQF